ncbi:hypothetical protein E0W60_34420 (plasmid) [Cupriavidus oxalaticus]|uniref:Uncharacterized protein n=1 Tax=Cupriavidus oxalaticus TaxID=96344 RepID=A0A4P7LIV6_9BURK|nr:hypothetical protein E0W60_34420 [Cupriavidus oxalaticus]
MLGDRRFFLESGFTDHQQLIDATYDVAEFWSVDPEVEMARPIGCVVEHFDQAVRINQRRAKAG